MKRDIMKEQKEQKIMADIVNHKEGIPLEHYLVRYRELDPYAAAKRTRCRYSETEKAFYIDFLGRTYRITWPDFDISCADDRPDYSPLMETGQAKILMIRFLLEGIFVQGTGKFLAYREVPWGEVYYRQFNGRCMQRLAFSYGNKPDEFRQKMEKLGAHSIEAGEIGYEIDIFQGYSVRFLLWAGDEDFPPSSQILFSDNFAAAFHAEDLVVSAEVVISALKKI